MGSQPTKEEDKQANEQSEPMVNQSKRKLCYAHRDSYYECVKEHGPDAAPTQCKAFRAEYEKHCLRSWVKYFDDQHRNQKYVDAERQRMQTQQPPRLGVGRGKP